MRLLTFDFDENYISPMSANMDRAIFSSFAEAQARYPDAKPFDDTTYSMCGPFTVNDYEGSLVILGSNRARGGYALVHEPEAPYIQPPSAPPTRTVVKAVPEALAGWLNDPNNDLDEIEGNLEVVRDADEPDTDPCISGAESILRDAGDTIEYAKANVSSLLSLIAILKEVSDVESSD